MADVVFVLGAGCSCDAGAPLMGGFLDRARDLLDAGRVEEWREDFTRVRDAVGRLGAVHSKSQLDVVNLESVFNAFEMATLLQKFPGLSTEQIDLLIPSMVTLIVRTLEETMRFPIKNGSISPPATYESFAKSVKWLTSERQPKKTVAVLTFNYDIGLDVALRHSGIRFIYGLHNEPTADVKLLKLHGSLNWFGKNENLIYLDVGKMIGPLNAFKEDLPKQTALSVSRAHPDLLALGLVGDLPFIVPPAMSKGEHQRKILPVWKQAALELGEARHIFICGYSLPSTDEFFKTLFALGTVGDDSLLNVVALNPDKPSVERIGGLLGPGALQRFTPLYGVFESLPSLVNKYLKVPS